MKLTNAMAWLAAALVVLGAGGCKNNKDPDFFKEDGEERVSRFTDIQASNGARNDAMLYAHHFTGGHLNSLGRTKILRMLEDCDSCDVITVHLVNAGEGDLLGQRKAAVELYLKTAEGPNKLTFHPAAPEMLRFNKTESGKLDGEASTAEKVGEATMAIMNDKQGAK
jgi:hypothetical protein